MKKPISIRIEATDIKKLKELGIDFPDLVRGVISEILNKKICPVCKGKMMKEEGKVYDEGGL